MFLPDVMAGRTVVVAGPPGPLAEAVADAVGRAGAAVVLCGQDVDRLDELAWDLAERRDTPVEIAPWDGQDPGAGLRAAVDRAGHGPASLVLLGAAGWSAEAAMAWADAGPVVVIASAGEGTELAAAPGALVVTGPAETSEERLAAWAAFLLTPAGAAAAGQIIRLR